MSRRQALGVLTNQANKIQQKLPNSNNANLIKQNSNTTTTTTTSITAAKQTVVNNENDYQQMYSFKSTAVATATTSQKTANFEFDVYQDENCCLPASTETNKFSALAPGQQQQQQASFDDDFNIYCDDSTNNDSSKNKNYHNKHEFKKQPLQAISLNLVNTSINSPMILDDTIKFQTTKSEFGEELDADVVYDDDDDEEEDAELDACKLASIERENVLMNCEEYAKDILVHLRQLELVNRPKASYIKQQQDITSTMRSILVDWLVEVSEEYKLHTETLYLAVNYTDRFLSKMSVLRGKLQLLGTASMYIASKYEEIFPPDAAEFVYITDDTYTKQQVLRMEHLVLKVLNFHMNAPTANCFLLHFLRYTRSFGKLENLSRYLAELTLVEADPFLEYAPSQIAASALYLAMYTLNKPWTAEIENTIGYKLTEIQTCISDLHKCWKNALNHPQQAIQEKYKQERFNYVSTLEIPEFLNF